MNNENYEDIINLPPHVSKKHPQMSLEDRSAQFAPFAALTGYEDAVEETARLTEERIEIDEDVNEKLNKKINNIKKIITKNPEITVTYFVADDKKSGGKYITIKEKLKRIDEVNQILIFVNGRKIKIKDIIDLI